MGTDRKQSYGWKGAARKRRKHSRNYSVDRKTPSKDAIKRINMKTRPDKLGLLAGLTNCFTIRSSEIPTLLVGSQGTDV